LKTKLIDLVGMHLPISSSNLTRLDPFLSHKFLVMIEGLLVAGFSEVSGLQVETEVEEVREGGVNDYVYKLPKGTKYQNLTLKKGMTISNDLWDWHRNVVAGKIKRKTIYVILHKTKEEGQLDWDYGNMYQIVEAFPVKWSGPDLKSEGNAVALETIEIAHHGIKKYRGGIVH
jgi:phage tail-like protein